MWLLSEATASSDPSWSLVIGPFGALALSLAGNLWLVKQLAAKDKQILASSERNQTLAEKAYPALTESTAALRDALERRGQR